MHLSNLFVDIYFKIYDINYYITIIVKNTFSIDFCIYLIMHVLACVCSIAIEKYEVKN